MQPSALTTVTNLRVAWSAAFTARDISKLAALYTPDALFFGSTPELFRGREGVREYFRTLRADVVLTDFESPEVVTAAADTIVTAGHWRFRFGAELRCYRLTWTIVRRDGAWLIAAHHASLRPASA